jgi:hypothetical protein
MTETRWSTTVAFLATSQLGFALIGLSTGAPAGLAAAAMIVVCQIPTVVALLLAGGARPEIGSPDDGSQTAGWTDMILRVSGLVVLVSGFWGQNAIVATLWSLGRRAAVPGAFPVGLADPLAWAGVGAMFLAAIAAARGAARDFGAGAAKESNRRLLFMPLIVGMLLGPLLGGVTEFRWKVLPGGMQTSAALFVPGIAVPVVLAGFVVGWLIARGGRHGPGSQFESLARLSRTRFYEDELCGRFFPGVSIAVGCLGRGCEWLLVEKGGELVRRCRGYAARHIASLQTGRLTFYVLSLMLTGVGLLAVLLALGRTR